ncbi:MBL fold metallo-hydrolase [Ectobacillus sp. JY-23]|uniref:MBL fold metallo-hydrolase n=1 Tax=Ectobacillus sp. JY-23 TaxID=2933872 RepID=UPI001FF5A2C1|nr:MBL fold metallo-hydrolase [Ectobacillus sp. JY-23]UOY92075.1 MBL fold metallo-hydrolase [Ectobacillus sp. JY-23]
MKLTVVGFWGGYPEAGEATSGYLLEYEGFQLLIDCGSGVLSQLQTYIGVDELDAVVISHYHHDHIADIGVLQYARLIQFFNGEKLPTLPIYGHQLDQQGFASLTHAPYTAGMAYNPEEELQIGPFTITFLPTKHPVPCFAMRITAGTSTIVYTADTSYLPELAPFTKGADLFICECNMYAHQDGKDAGHLNSTEAGQIAQEAKVGQLLLTHLPHAGNVADLVQEARVVYDGPIELARSGYIWNV